MNYCNGHRLLGQDQELHEKLDNILAELQSLRDSHTSAGGQFALTFRPASLLILLTI